MGTKRRTLLVGASVVLVAAAAARAAAPAPLGAGSDVETRVEGILRRMTLEEKLDYIGGHDAFYVRALPRLGLPAIRMADGPIGVRNVGPSTAYAGGIALAASWDLELAGRLGAMLGRDARARGVHIVLAPGVNIHRAPMCGRNFEYFGEDPFLAAQTTAAWIQGMQAQAVSATVKHFLGNNSEVDRHGTSSDIDERTLREIYLPAFEAAVRLARVGAVMSAYNMTGGVHMTQHEALNVNLLKQEWGFDGLLMSDWDATYDGVAAAAAGLDLEMPSGKLMNRTTLLPAIRQGKLPLATIDDKVRRILRLAVRFGWLDREQRDPAIPLYSQEGRQLALTSALESMVLLKNEGGLLPLDRGRLRTVAVIGPGAHPAVPVGGGSAQVKPFAAVSYLQGIADALPGVTVLFSRGVTTLAEVFETTDLVTAAAGGQPGLRAEYFDNPGLRGAPTLVRVDRRVDFSWDRPNAWPTGTTGPVSARWTGLFVPNATGEHRFVASAYGLDEYRLWVDGRPVMDRSTQVQPISVKTVKLKAGVPCTIRLEYAHHDHHNRFSFGVRRVADWIDPHAAAMAARVDVAVVLAGFDPTNESEGYDRTFQLPTGQDELIAAVAAANRKTVVVLTSGGSVDMNAWLDHVPALLQAWYPGQEGGTALAQLLIGASSPSGKLPVTFERRWEDNPVSRSYYPGKDRHIRYSEGVFLGYRGFDAAKRQPLFPFGFGLSYTTFAYGNLAVTPAISDGSSPVTVSFDVTNTGARPGAEVAQVYVGDGHAPVPRPPLELKGFARVALKPGETRRMTVPAASPTGTTSSMPGAPHPAASRSSWPPPPATRSYEAPSPSGPRLPRPNDPGPHVPPRDCVRPARAAARS